MPLRVWAAQDILGENDIDEYTIEDRNGSTLPVTTECPDVTPPETTCETVPDKLEDIDQIGESYEEGGDEYETLSETTYNLTLGVAKTVSETSCWFKCTSWGATEIQISSTKSAAVDIYKKTTLGKQKLYSYTGKNNVDKVVSDCAVNNDSTTFLIFISCPSLSSITCKMSEHTDSKTNRYGGIWRPYDSSAMYNSSILYRQHYYASATDVSNIYTLVSNTKFLDYQTKLAKGTISATQFILGLDAAGLFNSQVWTRIMNGLFTFAGFATFLKDPFDFKGKLLNEINDLAGYKGMDAYGRPIYENGICLIEYTYNTQTFYKVEKWAGSKMTGPTGWTGSWTTTNPNPFSDVSFTNSYYDEVMYVYNRSIMIGTTATSFSPNNNMKRCDFALLLYRMSGSPATGILKNTVLKDVPKTAYFYDAVVWAINHELIKGTAVTTSGATKSITFSPYSGIKKCDAILLLYRYADYKDRNMSGISGALQISDASSVPNYAVQAMKWAVKNNIISNSGYFYPQNSSLRYNLAVWLSRFCQKFYI